MNHVKQQEDEEKAKAEAKRTIRENRKSKPCSTLCQPRTYDGIGGGVYIEGERSGLTAEMRRWVRKSTVMMRLKKLWLD